MSEQRINDTGEHTKVFGTCENKCLVETASKKYIDGGLNAKQLLFNNDFQINQRGQIIYENNSSNVKYTLDMWYVLWGKVEVLDKGVRLSPSVEHGYLQQIFASKLEANKYTVCIKVNDKVYSYSGTLSETEMIFYDGENFQITVQYENNKSMYKVNFIAKQQLDIEYIDLFEGDIAYHHVKKKYEDDLWECQSYLQIISKNDIIHALNKFWGKTQASSLTSNTKLVKPMVNTPTISKPSDLWIYSNDTNTEYKNLITYYFNYKNNGTLSVTIQKKDDGRFTENNYCLSTQEDIVLTCEP